jgi:membrane fusion protein, multidrug efflux system
VRANRLTIAFILVLFLGSCSKGKKTSEKTTELPVIRDIQVALVRPETVEDSFESVGTVTPGKSTMLSSQTIGTIVAVLAKEGDRVKQGQTLIEIDARDLRAELEGAQAALEEANFAAGAAESAVSSVRDQKELAASTFKRYEPLVARGSVTPQEFDEVNAKRKVADAELARAEENLRAVRARRKSAEAKVAYAKTLLSYTKILSPFDGVVTAKNAEVGLLATPGSPLMTVEQSGPFRLEVQVGETWIAQVKLGMAARIAIDAIKAELTGKIDEIVPAGDPRSRTFTIKIGLPSHPLLRSGLYGRAVFPLGKTQVMLVPAASVVERGQLVGLYAVDDAGRVHLRLVQLGGRHDGKLEVLSGLEAGDRIVVDGIKRISEGSRIALPAVP